MSRRLFVVRVGQQNGPWATWSPRLVWSTPENTPQLIRSSWVEGQDVYVLFVASGDIPIAMTQITGVRARDNERDAPLPRANDTGQFQTIMTYTNLLHINPELEMLPPVLEEIRYVRGHQILVTNAVAQPLLHYFMGTRQNNVCGPIPNQEVNPPQPVPNQIRNN